MRSLVTVLACLACSAVPLAAATESAEPTTVSVVSVDRRDMEATLSLPAEFLPFQEVDVHAKIAGYVEHIFVDVGDRVSPGQLLATLEVPERIEEVQAAEAARRRAELEVVRAKTELERQEAAHGAAHLAYARLAKVTRGLPGIVPGQDVDDWAAKDRVAEAQVAAAKAAIAVAEQSRANADIEVQKARTMGSYASITAPFAGVISRRYAHTGSMIQQGTASDTQAKPVVRLSELDTLRLVVAVPESAVPRVNPGTPVDVTVSSLASHFATTVTRVSKRVETSTRTEDVEVDVANADGHLVPGMYATARITLEAHRGAIAVPLSAIARDTSGASAWRVVNGVLERRALKLGLETATHAEVLDGLAEGDRVVVGRTSSLVEGQRVLPQPLQTAGEVK